MKYPCLVKRRLCKTNIHVEIDSERVDKYGVPIYGGVYDGKCNYQDVAERITTDEKTVIEIKGKALFPGDIFPELPTIGSGTAIILGEEREIRQGSKRRNPDGTVNYTELEVI